MADIVVQAKEIFRARLEPLSQICDELQHVLDQNTNTGDTQERDRRWSDVEQVHKDAMACWQDTFGDARKAVEDHLLRKGLASLAPEHEGIVRTMRQICRPPLKMALSITEFENERNLRLFPEASRVRSNVR